ncbi:MAG TPA: glycosyltransferase family 4 protein [Anaerolineales bacterium]|nr:glycosyltransferase family 4 protein [Anaerolineales bacterium]
MASARLGLLHFTGPPGIGGVESTMAHQARFLTRAGWPTALIVGSGEAFDEAVAVRCLPGLASLDEDVLAAKTDLDRGVVGAAFDALRSRLRLEVQRATDDLDVLIVHNALSLHKNLALTAALWDLWQDRPWPGMIAWHHDLAWDRQEYVGELHPGEPWDLLRRAWPEVVQVVVSESARERWSRLAGIPASEIHVIPPGVDPAEFGRWTAATRRAHEILALEQADILLLLPSRVTRRKNIEFAIEIVAAMREQSDLDVRLLVTGPPGPHNPANRGYLDELLDLRHRLRMEASIHFLYRLEPEEPTALDDATLADLFGLADGLLFPSRDEGFGIPVLEAGLSRLPVFCSDISPFRETGGSDVTRFALEESPAKVARLILDSLERDPAYRLRRRVRREYTWTRLLRSRLLPLLEPYAHD